MFLFNIISVWAIDFYYEITLDKVRSVNKNNLRVYASDRI